MRLKRDWQVAELSLKARWPALDPSLRLHSLTRLLMNHSHICVCPLPAHLSGAKPGVETPSAQASSSEVLGVKAQGCYTVEMKCSSRFIFQFPPRLNIRLNCVFTARYFFTFQMNALTICL